MIEITKKENCCGCSACKSICPTGAITMKEDEEGFLYPSINAEKCIHCDACNKVCPIIHAQKEEEFPQKAYVLNNKEEQIRMQSTSGGAFTAIAEYVLENNGVVFGATFDEELNVVHTAVNKKEELSRFRNSKYVQSDMKDNFLLVKQLLEEGKMVCFSGTPCQIEGLKSFLKKPYQNLVTVDVVCRAVPSPKLYRNYLSYMKKKLKAKQIKQIIFRDKSKYGYRYTTMTIKTDTKEYRNGVESDPYLRAFFHNLCDRPSCHNCQFKKQYRVSDFTIWDCFIAEEFDKSLDDNKGTTRMLIHTQKGQTIFETIKEKFIYQEVEVQKLIKDVKEIKIPTEKNSKREEFFKDMNQLGEEEFFKKYFPDNIKVKAERYTRKLLVKFPIYKKVKKLAKKVLGK